MPSPPPPHQPPRALALTLDDRDAIRELRTRFSDGANPRQFDAPVRGRACDGRAVVGARPRGAAVLHVRGSVRESRRRASDS
jgi:hypothetical protein